MIFLKKRKVFAIIIIFSTTSIFLLSILSYKTEKKFSSIERVDYNQSESNFIFIGGYARSGTTLMRAILDTHEHIKCGPETKIIPSFVSFVETWKQRNLNIDNELNSAGLTKSSVDIAISNFIEAILLNRGFEAKRMCAKDPDVIRHMAYLHQLFPRAKFIYLIRDGRAAAYSHILKVQESMTPKMYGMYLKAWYEFNRDNMRECKKIGPDFCLIVKYEDLVLHPEKTLKNVMKFLNEEWNNELLRHHDHIDNITLSKFEWSTDQVIKPINTESLAEWVGKVQINEEDIRFIFPLLNNLGYSINQNDLNYKETNADDLVHANNDLIRKNRTYWSNKGKNITKYSKKPSNGRRSAFMQKN